MKFETLMLHSLFAACMLICLLTLGAMLHTGTGVGHRSQSGSCCGRGDFGWG